MPGKRDDKTTDLTVKILREIRDAARQTNVRLDQTNARLDSLQHETNARLDQTNSRLDSLQREMRESIGQTNTRLDSLQREMRKGFEHVGQRIDNLLLGPHREDHEQIHERLERIERHLDLSTP